MATDDTATEGTIIDQAEAKTDEVDVDLEQKALYLAAGLAIVGAFLPWYSVLGVSVIGIEGDGLISLFVAIVVIGLVWFLNSVKRVMVSGVIGGAIITFIAFYHVTGVSDMGVYLTLLGGLGMVVASVSGYRKVP